MSAPRPGWVITWQQRTSGALTQYQEDFLEEVNKLLPNNSIWASQDHFEGLALSGPSDKPMLIVFFSTDKRPGCRFGLRWPLETPVDLDYSVLLANIMETIDEAPAPLPTDCRKNDITWL